MTERTIAIIDDHAFVRSSIGLMLSQFLEVGEVVEAESAQALCDKGADKQYDLILLDYHIPGQNPAATFRAITDYFPEVPILYISSDEEPEIILATINNGAAGYVVKSSDRELFIAAIDLVLAGGQYLPIEVLHKTQIKVPDSLFESDKLLSLTSRQKEVFRLVVNNNTNKTIAQQLSISDHTVKSHIKAIYNVLGLKSREEVIERFKSGGGSI